MSTDKLVVALWNVKTHKLIYTRRWEQPVNAFAIAPDGNTLMALAGDHRGDMLTNAPGVTFWDTSTWQAKQWLRLNKGVFMLHNSPGVMGNTWIAGSKLGQFDGEEDTLKLWNLPLAPEKPQSRNVLHPQNIWC